jgi:hypothetical protein
MVKEIKFAQTGNNLNTNFADANVVGGKFHLKNAMKKAHVGRKVLNTANMLRKNQTIQDVVSDGVGTAVGYESGNPLLGVAAASGTKQLMGSGKGEKSLDHEVYQEIAKHLQTGGKRKLTLKKIITHPATKKVFNEIHKIAMPILKQAAKEKLEDYMNSSNTSTGAGMAPSVSGGAVKPKRGPSAWIQEVKAMQAKHGCSYKEAMKKASEMRKK